jgi:hypothetical protein
VAERGPDPQDFEVVGPDLLALQSLGLRGAQQGGLPRLHRGEVLERAGSRRELARGAVGDVQLGAVLPGVPHGEDALRVGVGQRADQDVIDRAEDGGRRADPETERESRDRGEARFHSQATHGIPEIAKEGLDAVLPAMAADLLPHAGGTAQLEPCRTESFLLRQSQRPMRRGGLAEVVLHFVRRLPLGEVRARQRAEAQGHPAQQRHRQPSASSRRAMAETRRDQSAVSTASCFRPSRVRM